MNIEAVVKTTKNNRRVKMAAAVSFKQARSVPEGAFNGLTATQQKNLDRERAAMSGAYERAVKVPAAQKTPGRKGLEVFAGCVVVGGAATGIAAILGAAPYILIAIAAGAVFAAVVLGIAVCAKNGGFNEAARNEFKKTLEDGWDKLGMGFDDFIEGLKGNELPGEHHSAVRGDPLLSFFENSDEEENISPTENPVLTHEGLSPAHKRYW
jgi:hypothetical protein